MKQERGRFSRFTAASIFPLVVFLTFTEETYSIFEGPVPVVVCLEINAGAEFPTERIISAAVSTTPGTALGNWMGVGAGRFPCLFSRVLIKPVKRS